MYRLCILFCLSAVLLFAGCTGHEESEPSEALKETRLDYNRGMEYDQAWQFRLAELYYGKVYRAMKENPEEDWWLYGEAGFRYAHLLTTRGDLEGAVGVLGEMMERTEGNEEFPAAQYSTVLSKMAYCQRKLNQFDAAKQTYAKAYEARVKAVGGEGNGVFDLVILSDCVFLAFFEMEEYDEAARWLDRADTEFRLYEPHGDSAVLEEYRGLQVLYRVRLLQATGHTAEAAATYAAIPYNRLLTPMGSTMAAEYLMAAGRYDEAADMYATVDTTFGSFSPTHITFDVVQEYLAPRYSALRRAGLADGSAPVKGYSAQALVAADSIVRAIDSALAWQKRNDATELAVIYQTHEKELALEEQQAKTVIYRILAIVALLMFLLVGYIQLRVRRYNRLLTEKNRRLYEYIRRREEAESVERQKVQSDGTLPQNQQLYNRLCELMKSPEVFTDAEANHETLARLVGTNYKYVYNALRECADTTPADFINLYRIRHAAHLLTATDDPVGLIVEQCGFTNRSTFTRLFRERYSMTPTEFRQAAR